MIKLKSLLTEILDVKNFWMTPEGNIGNAGGKSYRLVN